MRRALRWPGRFRDWLAIQRWRLIAVALSFALFAACTTLTPAVRPAPSALAPAFSAELADLPLRNAAFERAWRIVDERFYDPGFNGLDWAGARLRYLPQLERVDSDTAFYALLGRMVGELRDSHTRVYNARAYRNRLDYVVSTVGLRVAEVEGEVAITQVFPDTDAARAGLAAGMIVEAVNGEAARARLARLRVEAPADASPERRMRGVYGRLIAASRDKPVRLDVRASRDALSVAQYKLDRTEREEPLVVTHRMLGSNIGYIAFNRFRPQAVADIGRALGTMQDSDGLVLDLRGNSGGSIGAMLSIAQSFFPESRHVLTRRLRASDPAGRDGGLSPPLRLASPEVRVSASAHAYTRPLAVLVDGNSASSAELLATILREQRDAWIVGRPSCGCVVAVRGTGYPLPGGGALYVAESGFITPLGNRMEGAGMHPDREVPLALEDLREGVDRDLVVAMDWIRQRAYRVAEEH